MTRAIIRASVFGLFVILNIATVTVLAEVNDHNGILDCFYEKNSLACAKKRADAELDRIETEVTGKESSMTFSKVLEETGDLVVDGTRSLLGLDDRVGTEDTDAENTEDTADQTDSGLVEGRKHKFGKKKKKALLKLVPLIMMFKAKIGLLLQLISTHFQLKFFVISIIGLLINVARFWIDIKKTHQPAKVVYYEHAQHQHHYDHDQDDHGGGYWKRSAEPSPQELAYNAYTDQH